MPREKRKKQRQIVITDKKAKPPRRPNAYKLIKATPIRKKTPTTKSEPTTTDQ